MAYKSRNKQTSRRRRSGVRPSRRKRYAVSKTVVRSPTAVADQYYCKLKYHTLKQFTASASLPQTFLQINNAATINTADATAPYGFDQLTALYNKQTVLGAKVTVTASSAINTVGGQGRVMMLCLDSNTALTDPSLVFENERTRVMNFGTLTGSGPNSMTKYYSMKQLFGKKSISDPEYSGTASAAPDEKQFLHIYAIAGDEAALVECDLQIDIVLYIRFWDRQQFGAS